MSEERIKSQEEPAESEPLSAEELSEVSGGVHEQTEKSFNSEQKQK